MWRLGWGLLSARGFGMSWRISEGFSNLEHSVVLELKASPVALLSPRSPQPFPFNSKPRSSGFCGSVNEELQPGWNLGSVLPPLISLGFLILLLPFPWTCADLHPPQPLESLPAPRCLWLLLPNPWRPSALVAPPPSPRAFGSAFPNFLPKPLRKSRPSTDPPGSSC